MSQQTDTEWYQELLIDIGGVVALCSTGIFALTTDSMSKLSHTIRTTPTTTIAQLAEQQDALPTTPVKIHAEVAPKQKYYFKSIYSEQKSIKYALHMTLADGTVVNRDYSGFLKQFHVQDSVTKKQQQEGVVAKQLFVSEIPHVVFENIQAPVMQHVTKNAPSNVDYVTSAFVFEGEQDKNVKIASPNIFAINEWMVPFGAPLVLLGNVKLDANTGELTMFKTQVYSDMAEDALLERLDLMKKISMVFFGVSLGLTCGWVMRKVQRWLKK